MTTTTAEMTRRLFTVDEYHRMEQVGILREDERIELIDGEILEMCALGGPHVGCVIGLTNWFAVRLAGRTLVSIQNPVQLSDYHEPLPDVVLLRPDAGRYHHDVPTAADVLLLVEVSDTTLAYDRDMKIPRYAAAGIPEVWIVDLNGQRIHIYRDPIPTESRYGRVTVHERGSAISPGAFPDISITCDEILR